MTNYNSLNDRDDSQIYYRVNDQQATFYLREGKTITGNWSDDSPINNHLNYSVFDSLVIDGVTFRDVLAIQFIDSLEISQFWVEKSSGLVAYEKDNMIFKKE